MNTVDKITKEAKILIDSAKDTVDSNLALAAKDGSLSLREDQVSKLIDLVDQSFQRSFFSKWKFWQLMLKPVNVPSKKTSKYI